MNQRTNEYQVVGTAALKPGCATPHRAAIIEFPGARPTAQAPTIRPSVSAPQASLSRARQTALHGVTRESLKGTAYQKLTRAQSVGLGFGGLAFALAVMLIGA